MKRIALLTTFLVFSNIYAAKSPFQGPYLNLGIGGTNANFNVNQQLIASQPGALNQLTSNNPNQYENDLTGGGGIGYTQVFNKYFALGIEATANLDNVSMSNDFHQSDDTSGANFTNHVAAKLKNNFALLIKPGFLVNQNTMLYALIGPRWGNFETTTQTEYFQPLGTNNFSANIPSTTRSGYKTGLTMGLGMQENLGKGFSFGLEYAYTDYGNITTTRTLSSPLVNSEGTTVGTFANNIRRIHVQTNTVMFNLYYTIA